MQASTRWHVFTDAEAVAAAAARRILAAAAAALATRGVFRIVLAGGRTPLRTYGRLSQATTDWTGWRIYFSDERCLPPAHEERNSRTAALAWLDRVPIPAANIHPIPAERGAETAAFAYSRVVSTALPFDLVTLGMGEDGHTASLFPGQVYPTTASVLPVHGAPKPPPDRVSLSANTLSNSRESLILVTGVGKREAITAWRRGEPLPVTGIGGQGGVDVLLDQTADPDRRPLF